MEENIYNLSLQIMLSKSEEQPWGFRITGGADFGTPVTIIKVYGGSIAEQAGLKVDDMLIGINEYPITNLSHQEAYQAFIDAGNSFLLSILRGGQISSQTSNMAMEMAFMENEYVNASPQELSTSEKITATEIFKQQTVEEQVDNTTLNSQSEFGLDAIIAAVLSQGIASQDATESETFNDIYVNQDIEKQFDNLSYILTEKVSNIEEHATSTYIKEEVDAVEFRDYKDDSYTMEKNLAAEQQLKGKTDYQYNEQQLEFKATETKTDHQYNKLQLEAETTETKTDYQCSEHQLQAEMEETKTVHQSSEQQLQAETAETKADHQSSEQQLQAETAETKTDHQSCEQQLEAKAAETKTDQSCKQQLEAKAAETKTGQSCKQQLEAKAAETKPDQSCKQQLEAKAAETKTDQSCKQQLEAKAAETKTDQSCKQQLEAKAAETKTDQSCKQQLEAKAAETKTDQSCKQQLEAKATETKTDQSCKQQLEAKAAETKTDHKYIKQQLEAEAKETKADHQFSEQQLQAETVETKADHQYSEKQLEAETAETITDHQYSEQLQAETSETKTDHQYNAQQLEVEATEMKTDHHYSEQKLKAEAIETKMTAEEEPPMENKMGDTGVKKQHSDMQLKGNIKKNRQFLPLAAYPRPVLEAGSIKLTIPKEIYDDEFIAETLSGNAEIITGTTLGVNFHKYRRNYDYLKSSSVYQLIHDEENKG